MEELKANNSPEEDEPPNNEQQLNNPLIHKTIVPAAAVVQIYSLY